MRVSSKTYSSVRALKDQNNPKISKNWCPHLDLNQEPPNYRSGALPLSYAGGYLAFQALAFSAYSAWKELWMNLIRLRPL
jgi:hypothetical protein